MAEPTHTTKKSHLCVFVHGLWGHPKHLNFLRDTLEAQSSTSGVYCLVPKSNAEYNTYDGIEVGAERITNEIEQTIRDLESQGSKIKKISIVGYSLGGLIARYAIGLMYKSGMFDNIEPVNFTTFATPHLGVRTPRLSWRSEIWNVMGSRTLSTSGQQMFTMDKFRETGRPLLSVLADRNSVFMKGLRLFKNRTVYANCVNDRSVPFYTAGISRVDPFVDLSKAELNYLPNQDEPVILDPSHPVFPKQASLDKKTTSQRLKTWYDDRKSVLPFYALFFTLVPIFLPLFLARSAWQTYKSSQRVKLHESGQAGISLGRYRIPLLEDAQVVQDRLYERMTEQESEEYLPTPPPESSPSSGSGSTSSLDAAKTLARTESAKESSPFPILALTEEQFAMIDSLNELGFEKFPVHIKKHRHTHAAIVVRTQKDGFEEGKAVVRHWAGRLEV